jgi:hypothetical protein
MSAHHHPADTDYLHDTATDVTTAHEPTPAQREVIDLLGLNPDRRRCRRRCARRPMRRRPWRR